jgi:hypothetical protein
MKFLINTIQIQQIPSWITNNAEWWTNGQISDNDFVKGIQYIVTQRKAKASDYVGAKN